MVKFAPERARGLDRLRAMIAALLLVCAAVQSPVAKEQVPTALFVPARRWAIVVGAGRYEYLGKLDYAKSDARAFADALERQLGFERDHIRLLVDDEQYPELTPTLGHVRGQLESLILDRRASSSDLFVFYFCGHGIGRADGDILLPIDARKESIAGVGLPVKEVVDHLAQAGMRNVLVLVDVPGRRSRKSGDFPYPSIKH